MKRSVKRALLWTMLLCKRLYKKPTFLLIMVLVPLVVFGYTAVDTQDSGMVTIALAKDGEDAVANDVISRLQNDTKMIRYITADSRDAAERLVRAGKADAAWVFPHDMTARVKAFVKAPKQNSAFVSVYEREENVMMLFARERLSGAVYRSCVQTLYLNYVDDHLPEMSSVSDEKLLEYYEKTAVGGKMFTFADIESTVDVAAVQDVHYLLAPVRGLLAAMVLLAGLATALYYYRDIRNGTFARMRLSRRPFAELGCQAVSVVHVTAVALVSLMIVGLAGAWWKELLLMVLYSICVIAFCMMVRRLCGNAKILAALLPMLIIVVLLVCPVFFDLSELHGVQLLLPPTYYIHAAYNTKYLWYMPLYAAACFAVYWLLGKYLKRE